jgi:hypothetical protein
MSARRTSSLRISRRRWTALLGIAPLVAPFARAQDTSKRPPQGAPAPAPAQATPEAKLQKAYADVHDVSVRLSRIEVPMNIEAAFVFKP